MGKRQMLPRNISSSSESKISCCDDGIFLLFKLTNTLSLSGTIKAVTESSSFWYVVKTSFVLEWLF